MVNSPVYVPALVIQIPQALAQRFMIILWITLLLIML
jgi:hypothetical protein